MRQPSVHVRRFNVSVIGGYRASRDEEQLAFGLGKSLVQRGFNVVTGGRAGVMLHVAKGGQAGKQAGGEGVLIGILPGTDPFEANPFLDVVLPTGMGYLRNGLVACAGDAVVAVGGMAGTLSELALAWQMGKPVCFLGNSKWAETWGGRSLDEKRDDPIPLFDSPEQVASWVDDVTGRQQDPQRQEGPSKAPSGATTAD